MAIIEKQFEIAMEDVDKNNKLTNSGLLRFLQKIACIHSDIAGYGLKNVFETNLSWVLLGYKIKIIKRPNYADLITIKTWNHDFNKIFTYRDFEIYSSTGELLAIASSKWVLINLSSGLVKLTPEISNKFESEEKHVFNDIEIKKLKEPLHHSNEFNYAVLRNNIDINNHMNNVFYLNLAYETLPEDVYSNNEFNNIEIFYKSSALLYSNLKCLYSKIENEHFITIKSDDLSTLHTIIKLS